MSTQVLVFGATSAMAQGACRKFASAGAKLFLVARDSRKLSAVANDLRVRGAEAVQSLVIDLNDLSSHQAIVTEIYATVGEVDHVLIAHGYLGEQAEAERDPVETERILLTNFNGAVSLLTIIANQMEQQKRGTIAVISSVAGDRGRRSNYVYGAAKGGLSVFMAGLEIRLAKAGVRVLTIKPGFVDSPMTKDMKKGPLWASSDLAGSLIQRAMLRKRGTVYVPGIWRLIMLIIRLIPAPIFRRLPL